MVADARRHYEDRREAEEAEVLEGFAVRGYGRTIELSAVFRPFSFRELLAMWRGNRLQFRFVIEIDDSQVPRGIGAQRRLVPPDIIEEALR